MSITTTLTNFMSSGVGLSVELAGDSSATRKSVGGDGLGLVAGGGGSGEPE